MKILTIGPSPTLLTSGGDINRSIIEKAIDQNWEVESLVWHHNVEYFLPNQIGKHFFPAKKSVRLHPFLDPKGMMALFAFETMKEVQPDVVITIGNYYEVDFVAALKSLYGNLFKWIAVITCGEKQILDQFSVNLSLADEIVVTTISGTEAIKKNIPKVKYLPYGPSSDFFASHVSSDFKIINMGKNSQMSNLPALIFAAAEAEITTTLHTNIHDHNGDYDIQTLLSQSNPNIFSLPKTYTSIKDGCPREDIIKQYSNHTLIVDCSLQSNTALTLLEGMASGCIPVGTDTGAMGEILDLMPSWCRFVVPHAECVSPKRCEKTSIILQKELSKILVKIRHKSQNLKWLEAASLEAIKVAEKFRKEVFLDKIKEMVENVLTKEHFINVDTF